MKQVTAYEGDVRPVGRSEEVVEDIVAQRRHVERLKLNGFRLLLGVIVLVIWQAASGTLVDPFWISRPSDVVTQLGRWIGSGSLFFHLQITLLEMVLGFVIGALAGIFLGMILGLNQFLSKLVDPFLIGFYSLPKIALAPLFILWFGIGLEPKIILAAVIVFFLVFMNTFAGVRDVDQELIDVLRVMGARRHQIIWKVVLPSALAWVFAGLKLSVPHALTGAVVGELFASNKGLGYLLAASSGQFDTAGVFAVILVLTVLGIIINEIVNRSEGILMRWRVVTR